jgi:hypothetical protein
MLGVKFGRLEVIAPHESYVWVNKQGKKTCKSRFLCLCECGNECVVLGNNLRNGRALQCQSCSYKTRPQSTRKQSDMERLFRLSVVQRSLRAGIEYDITVEQFSNIVRQNCYYCGVEPRLRSNKTVNKYSPNFSLYANGVDRRNNDIGYTVANCLPCCKDCNTAKASLSAEDFFSLIARVYDKHCKL